VAPLFAVSMFFCETSLFSLLVSLTGGWTGAQFNYVNGFAVFCCLDAAVLLVLKFWVLQKSKEIYGGLATDLMTHFSDHFPVLVKGVVQNEIAQPNLLKLKESLEGRAAGKKILFVIDGDSLKSGKQSPSKEKYTRWTETLSLSLGQRPDVLFFKSRYSALSQGMCGWDKYDGNLHYVLTDYHMWDMLISFNFMEMIESSKIALRHVKLLKHFKNEKWEVKNLSQQHDFIKGVAHREVTKSKIALFMMGGPISQSEIRLLLSEEGRVALVDFPQENKFSGEMEYILDDNWQAVPGIKRVKQSVGECSSLPKGQCDGNKEQECSKGLRVITSERAPSASA